MRSPGDLPYARTSFVGRDRELGRICRDLRATARLLTVTGLGGTGKTRLAYEVASLLHDDFDEIRVADLAALDDPLAVTGALLAATGRRATSVAEAIGTRRVLLVVDNCEHLRDEVAEVIDGLLEDCRNVRILATSREPLRLAGEHVLVLGTLALSHARILFRERAAAAGAKDIDDATEDATQDAVTRICLRLDCLPLAVELAATKARLLPPPQLAELLDQRIDVLAGDERDAPARHRSVRALLDWSYQLLAPDEAKAFRFLAVFATGATLPACESVCGPFATFWSLTDKGLVVTESGRRTPRLRLLQTVREYALDRLTESGEAAEAHARHAAWYVAWALDAKRTGADDESVTWLEEVRGEQDETSNALRHLLRSGRPDDAVILAAVTWRIWEVQGRIAEGRRLVEDVLCATEGSSNHDRAWVLQAAGTLAFSAGDHTAATAHQWAAVDAHLAGEHPAAAALAKNSAGMTLFFSGRSEQARAACAEALSELQGVGDERGTAVALSSLGLIAGRAGEYHDALTLLLESNAILRRLGRRSDAAAVLTNLGDLALDHGDLPRATRFYEGGLQLHRATGDERGAALCLNNMSVVASRRGDLHTAVSHAEEALSGFREVGDRQGVAATLHNLANLATEQGSLEVSAFRYRESLEEYEALGDPSGEAIASEHLGSLAWREGRLGDARKRFGVAGQRYRELGLGEPLQRVTSAIAALDSLTEEAAGGSPRSPIEVSSSASSAARSGAHSSLTMREAEVAELVAAGLSNREIADRLFVSERTINSHISHIRTKLGTTSRTQLALWAAARRDHPQG